MDNSIAGRMDFDLAVKIFNRAFGTQYADFDAVSAFRLTQSRLRLEQPILATTTQYYFPVLNNIQNQAQQFNTEVRLTMQDSFIPTRVGIYLGHPTSATDATFPLLTYLNPFIFTNAAAMEVLYNGVFSIMIDQTQYLLNWPMAWHKNVPQTQQTAAAGAGSPLDQFDGNDYSLKSMQPFVLLSGAKNIKININVPVAPTAVDAFSRIIVVFDGILAQNSTVVN